uniref:Uncharacterized protein n=1 Tax=Panagrolaimus sp. JU765 TaxID=591449 RepID=A0AC34R6R0_9BILA
MMPTIVAVCGFIVATFAMMLLKAVIQICKPKKSVYFKNFCNLAFYEGGEDELEFEFKIEEDYQPEVTNYEMEDEVFELELEEKIECEAEFKDDGENAAEFEPELEDVNPILEVNDQAFEFTEHGMRYGNKWYRDEYAFLYEWEPEQDYSRRPSYQSSGEIDPETQIHINNMIRMFIDDAKESKKVPVQRQLMEDSSENLEDDLFDKTQVTIEENEEETQAEPDPEIKETEEEIKTEFKIQTKKEFGPKEKAREKSVKKWRKVWKSFKKNVKKPFTSCW